MEKEEVGDDKYQEPSISPNSVYVTLPSPHKDIPSKVPSDKQTVAALPEQSDVSKVFADINQQLNTIPLSPIDPQAIQNVRDISYDEQQTECPKVTLEKVFIQQTQILKESQQNFRTLTEILTTVTSNQHEIHKGKN